MAEHAYQLLANARVSKCEEGTVKAGEYTVPRSELSKWKEFLNAFLADAPSELLSYAHRPETFPLEDFRKVPLVSRVESGYTGTHYRVRGSHVRVGTNDSSPTVYLDAPFGYGLLFRRSDGVWEPISVLAMMPDWKSSRLKVDQLQAGSTSRQRMTTKEGWRSRMKFKTSPENMLFDGADELALRLGMQGIDLRKGGSNKWFIRDYGNSYEKIAALRSMQDGGGEYYTRELNP